MVREIKSGNIVERNKVWIAGEVIPRRHRVKGSTTASRKVINKRAAVKEFARVLNCNFHMTDMLVTLTFDEEHLPQTVEAVQKTVDNFLMRLQRHLGKLGVAKKDFKRVVTISDKADHHSRARYHAHLVMTGEQFRFADRAWWVGQKKLAEIWGQGAVNCEATESKSKNGDLTPLAAYLLGQAADGCGKKTYRCSRNMDKPIVTEYVAVNDSPLRAPAGVTPNESYYLPERGMNYVRYTKPTTKRKGGRRDADGGTEAGD